MGTRLRGTLFAAIIAGCTVLACMATARLYWGYWIFIPSANWLVAPIASVERFTTFSCCTPSDARSGASAVEAGARLPFFGAGDWPARNLPEALVIGHLLPTNADAVSATVLTEVQRRLDANGVLVAGEPGYPLAKKLWGHVAVGRGRDGGEIVASALWSGEVSDDHHAYYETLFSRSPSGDLRVVGVRQYWFDVAGLEGIAHWLAGLAAFFVAAVGCVFYLAWQRPHSA
jgi:hypothetical protein